MTLDEVIKEFTDWAKDNRKEQNFWAAERDENDETNPLSYADCEGLARDAETRAEYHEQLAEGLKSKGTGGLKMNHDEFISRVRTEIAKSYGLKTDAEIDAFFLGIEEGVKDKQEALEKRDKMLRDTVAELCEAKRLLKMAVPIINNSFPEVGSCWGCANHDEENDECKGGAFAECANVCKWKYADEALKLIGEDEDENS